MYTGVDMLTIAKIIKDNVGGYEATAPVLFPINSIDLKEENAVSAVVKDGRNVGTYAIATEPAIKINTKSINPAFLNDIFHNEEQPAFFDSGINQPNFYTLGYRVKKNNGSYDYCNYLKGVIEVNPKDVNNESGVIESITFKPLTTNHVFDYNGKPCRYMVVNNTAKDIQPDAWLNTVWTPDNLLPVPAPAIDIVAEASGGVAVVMRAVRPNDTIRYTTDGTTPTLESPIYTEPLTVEMGAVVRAIECAECKAVSPVATALAMQKCAMPELVIKCETPIITVYGELVIYI